MSLLTPAMWLDVNMNVVLHEEKSKGIDQGHHGLAMGGGLSHDVYY